MTKQEEKDIRSYLEKRDKDTAIDLALQYRYERDLMASKLSKLRDYIENVLDKALKNSSLNQKYYDEILDYIDRQIGG